MPDDIRQRMAAAGIEGLIQHRHPGPVGFTRVRPLAFGLYEPCGQTPAFVAPVWSSGPGSKVFDLVAWHHRRPAKFFLRTGTGDVLGLDNFDHAEIRNEPLFVQPHPQAWFAGGGKGIAVLDWSVGPRFRALPRLIVPSIAAGHALIRRLEAPTRLPEIHVAAEEA